MKLLWIGETPYIQTGAGQVAAHLLPVFQICFDKIHLVAINQWWTQENICPCLTIDQSTQEDPWNQENAKRRILERDYDCLFVTADLNKITDLYDEIRQAHEAGKPIIIYAAMDTHIFQRHLWEVLLLADIPIVFSEWCKRQAVYVLPEIADKIRVLYHGCEPNVFYPLSEEERQVQRQRIFGITDPNIFLVLNVNRNQVRKDLARSMAAFHLFHIDHPNSLLYIHAKQKDVGGHLPTQAAYMGLKVQGENPEIVFSPEEFHESAGVSRAELNQIYNCADVCISTSTGEGWGLTTTEAMAAGVPFIGPDNTVFPELLEDTNITYHHYRLGQRGLLVESGGPDLWALFYGISDTPRELCSVIGMSEAIKDVYDRPYVAKARAERAREWTIRHTWQAKQLEWSRIFGEVTHASNEAQTRGKEGRVEAWEQAV